MALRTSLSFLFSTLLWICPAAMAQDDGDDFSLDDESADATGAAQEPAPEAGTLLLSDEQALQEEKAPEDRFRESTDPYEAPDETYLSAGASWRFVRLPAFTLELFLESAPSVGTAGSFFGELGYRKDGFQITATVGYMKWKFNGPFQLAGDPDLDTEWLDADFNLGMGTAAFTWSTAFTDWFALEYGLEAGIAFIGGDMVRSEAYRDNDGDWARCDQWGNVAGVPGSGAYCAQPLPDQSGNVPATNSADEEGEHYGVKVPKGIGNKGIPRALPILGPRLSLRFKPIHQLILRVDVPLPLFPMGFVGGLSAHYGF